MNKEIEKEFDKRFEVKIEPDGFLLWDNETNEIASANDIKSFIFANFISRQSLSDELEKMKPEIKTHLEIDKEELMFKHTCSDCGKLEVIYYLKQKFGV